jgi:hypothetical protein
MKFVEVAEVPEKVNNTRRKKGELKLYLDRFIQQGIKIAKVEFVPDEYYAMIGVYNSMRLACKWHVLPIDVTMRKGEVYLVRRDL